MTFVLIVRGRIVLINSNELGGEIKRLRKQNSLTQKQLAEGICCQTTISSIEKGRAFPSIDVLYLLSLRLNVSMDYFFGESNINEVYINDTIKYIDRLTEEKNYHDIFELTINERKLREKRELGEKFNQFIDWHYFRSAQLIGKITWDESVKELSNIIKQKSVHKLKFQDIKIKNVIANILAENDKSIEAENIYEEILYTNIDLDSFKRYKLKVYFNLSKLHFYEKNYKKSIQIADKGIENSLKLKDITVLGNLYIQAAQSMLNINYPIKEIRQYIENAKYIFKLLDKEWYLEFIERLEAEIQSE